MNNSVTNSSELMVPRHLGIILDGNGRWAKARNLPRTAGHYAGLQNGRKMIQVCTQLGIPVLTLYVFSTENWNRPVEEVAYIMQLAKEFVAEEVDVFQRNGIRLQLMGKREGIPAFVMKALDELIDQTRNNSGMVLNLAFNYGGRVELIDATKSIINDHEQGEINIENLNESTLTNYLYCPECPDLDLMIRTSGENRVSNFLLWRSVNAVFVSLPVLWPDFKDEDLLYALSIYTEQITEQLNEN